MVDHLYPCTTFRGDTVTFCDVDCRAICGEVGHEEWSDTHDIVFPRTGLFVRHNGRRRIVADCNHALFFNRGEPFRVSHPVAGGDRCTVLTVAGDSLTDAVSRYDRSAGVRPAKPFSLTHGPIESRTTLLLQCIRRCLHDATREPMVVEEAALSLLDSTVRSAFEIRGKRSIEHRGETTTDRRGMVGRAKTVMGERFTTRLTIEALGRAVACSPYHLCRLFRQCTGTPIHRYLNQLRLRVSLERLADGVSLTELALDLGFSSHAHFTESFRRQFGMPPSAFRRRATTTRLREFSKNLKA